jgi:hypothetical protein
LENITFNEKYYSANRFINGYLVFAQAQKDTVESKVKEIEAVTLWRKTYRRI